MQIYVGLGSDSEILLGEKKADVYANAQRSDLSVSYCSLL